MPENTTTTTLFRTGRLLAGATVLVLSVGSLTACGPTDDKSGGDDSKSSSTASSSTSGPSAPGESSSSPDAGKSPGATPTTGPGASSSPMAKRHGDDPDDRLHQWMDFHSIPMYSDYHWPELENAAKIADGEKFFFEEHCGSQRTPQTDSLAHGAWIEKSRPGNNDGDQNWLAQETVADVKQGGKQNAPALFAGLAKELKACPSGTTSVKFTTQDSRHVAATMVFDGDNAPRPTTLHEYLAVDGDSVYELSMWVMPYNDGANKPDVAWPNPSDASVFDAMTLPGHPSKEH